MSRIALSNTGSWELKFDEQDVRGYDALDADGNKVGEVDTMIVNTDERRVDAVLLEDGSEYPARDLSIGDGVVYLTTLTGDKDLEGTVTVYNDKGHVVERETVEDADYDAYRDTFRQHHAETYGASGRSFDTDEDAYRYGYESAYEDSYRDRAFVDAENDLRSGYTSRVCRPRLRRRPRRRPLRL